MVKLLYYGLSQQLMGYCVKTAHKKNLKTLSNNLKTLAANNHTISMSAIQIGQTFQYFVMLKRESMRVEQWGGYGRVRPGSYKGYLNGEIKDQSKEQCAMWEECCSYPGLRMLISRPKSIKLYYMDQQLKQYTEEMDSFEARVVQHEIDHHTGQDYLKKAEKIQLTDQKMREKSQEQCNKLLEDYKQSMREKESKELEPNNKQFNKLRQFITYSVVDKLRAR